MRPLHELVLAAASRQGPEFSSRRGVLALAAAVAAAPAVLGPESATAKGKGGRKGMDRKRRNRGGSSAGDLAVLNYALTVEYLEYAFYRDGLEQFDAGDFDSGVFAKLTQIRDHEGTHVDALSDTIDDLGGDPVEEACYDFGDDFEDPDGFLGLARLLEDTGVMAYTGALAGIKSGALQTTGATIATVEARHASYLRLLVLNDPFPTAFDEPKPMEEILAAAGGFIVDCP